VWVVWTVIALSVGGAFAAQLSAAPRFPVRQGVAVWCGVAVMAAGLALRSWAIATLGRMFSVDVAIQPEHRIVRAGPYHSVRHPSYTGMLLAFAGLGIALGNWLSLALAVVPTTAVILFRVNVEERALMEEFGDVYARYREETYRLFPGLC